MIQSHYSAHHESPGDGTVIRQPSSAQLLIDSLDRYEKGYPPTRLLATTSSQWSLQLKQIAMNGYIRRLAVSQIQFQWNLPTIITGYNDQLGLNISGNGAGLYTVTLNQGFYTPTTLAAEAQRAMNTANVAATFTVTFSALNNNFLFSVANGSFFDFFPNAFTGNERQHKAYSTLGITGGYGVSSTTSQSGNIPTMLPTRYIDICSSYLTKYQKLKDTNTLATNITSDCISRVFPVAPNTQTTLTATSQFFPSLICIDYGSPKQIAWSPDEGISNFDIRLLDEDGQLIPWSVTAGCEYNMVLLASET